MRINAHGAHGDYVRQHEGYVCLGYDEEGKCNPAGQQCDGSLPIRTAPREEEEYWREAVSPNSKFPFGYTFISRIY